MDWINLHIPSVIRSPAFIGSSPAERGVWLCVLAYACEIECGGRLVGAGAWKDRQWQQACGVTLREVRTAWKLLQVEGDDVLVNGYPAEKEQNVRQARGVALAGAMARWGKTPPGGTSIRPNDRMPVGNAGSMPTGIANGNAEGEGEGEGEGEVGAASRTASDLDPEDVLTNRPPPPPADLTAISDDDAAMRVRTWINCRSKDRTRERENRAIVAAMVAKYGPKVVQAAAERVCQREHRQAWPNEVLPEILAGEPGAAPQASPEAVRASKAADLVHRLGWEACCRAADLPPATIRTAATMVEAMRDPGIFARVVASIGGAA